MLKECQACLDGEITYMSCFVCPRILAASVGMIDKYVC